MLPRHKLAARGKRTAASATLRSLPTRSSSRKTAERRPSGLQSSNVTSSEESSELMDEQFPDVPRPKGGVLLEVPHRHPRLPRLYRVDSHVKVKPEWYPKRIFIYLQDTSPAAMEQYYKYVASMPFPEGTKRGIRQAGFIYLERGDYVLCRDIHGSLQEADDVLQLWVPSDGIFTPELRSLMEDARREGLGPREDRTPDKPVKKPDGSYEGGAKYERDDHALHVSNAPRCYTLAQSYQVQRNLAGPTASAKVSMGQSASPHLLSREKIIKVCCYTPSTPSLVVLIDSHKAAAPVAIAALEAAPEEISLALKRQAEVTNLPRVGYDGNYAYPTMQANFAATQRADALALHRMKADFGTFGGKHVDHNDSPGGFTSMITYGDIAPDEDPGVFIVGDLGVAIPLGGLIVINFCGLRYHGGYPPTAAPGKRPKRWSYRFTIVCYPPRAMLDARALLSFAVLPGNKMFAMPPEFLDPRFDKEDVTTNVANWVTSGLYLTSPASFLRFYYRTFCQMAYHFGRQVGNSCRIDVDYEKLAECFTLVEKDGTQHRPEYWQLHPGSTERSDELRCTREESIRLWQDHTALYGGLIPYEVHSSTQKQSASQKTKSASSSSAVPKPKRAADDSGRGKGRKKKKMNKADASDVQVPPPSATSAADLVKKISHITNAAGPVGPSTRKRTVSFAELDDYSADDEGGPSQDSQEADAAAEEIPLGQQPVRTCHQALGYIRTSQRADDEFDTEPAHPEESYSCVPDATQANPVPSTSEAQTHPARERNSGMQSQVELDDMEEILPMDQMPGTADPKEDFPSGKIVAIPALEHQDRTGSPVSASSVSVVARPASGDAPFQKILDIFSLAALQQELRRFKKLERRLSADKGSAVCAPETAMTDFAEAMHGDQSSTVFADAVTKMWRRYKALKVASDIADLHLAAHRREIMLSNAAAWYWLTQRCSTQCRQFAAQLSSGSAPCSDCPDWIQLLCRDVHADVTAEQEGTYHPHRYLPNMPPTRPPSILPSPSLQKDGDVASVVSEHVITLLRDWLEFPNNTEMLSGYYVMYVVAAFKNIDVLLLDGIWRGYRYVKASILGEHSTLKAPHLRVAHLLPFVTALTSLPLAAATSAEARTLEEISEVVERCIPGVKRWTSALVSRINTSDDQSTPSGRDTPLQVLRPSHLSGPPPTPSRTPQQAGLHALTEFALHLIPVAMGDSIAHPTALQQTVLQRPDHYLPFREIAICRQRASGPGGPYHPDLRDSPGAFPSWLIFRALLFDSPVMKERTRGYFQDHDAWKAFLAAEGYNANDKTSLNHFFNVTCYGTPQNPRQQCGTQYAQEYFEAEPLWTQLLREHDGKPIPFLTFFFWTLGQRMKNRDEHGKPRLQKLPNIKFNLVGKLTGYLLAADLVYTGKVQRPTPQEVAMIIRWNAIGSLRALVTTSQVSEVKCSYVEVEEAFSRVYTHLRQSIPSQYHAHIVFDEIMVEHLLCKFERTKDHDRSVL
ncbi:hypothetical protein C8Q76DRAFT_690725 [Earliella scabrosa]|nr:hypothetical protein C8Q76DRAFT_690725 [Earliella scabrosa]